MNSKIIIIGCGHWGKNYVRIFSGLLGPGAVAAVDSNDAVLRSVSKSHGGVETAGDLDNLLAKRSFGMAVVSTPAATHYDVAARCLEAGLDVLAEKPLTLNAAEAVRLANLARRKRRILMVGHTFLYNPAVRKMRDLLNRGTCGKIYYMKATRTHLGLVRPDVNAVWDLAPHDVAIFNYLTGSVPVSVIAVGGCYLKENKEDVAFITLQYPKNILGHIHVSWADSNKERVVEVVGSKARLVFDDLNTLERLKIFEKGISANITGGNNFGEFLFALRDGDIISPRIENVEPLAEVCKEFLRCVESRKQPLSGAGNAIDVVRVMCAVERSLRGNGKSVALRKERAR